MNAIFVSLIFAVVVSVASSLPQQKYTTRYDQVDIDSILKNERVLTSYVNCILDKGPCTQEGREFRKHIPEAIATNCEKCTDGQKTIIRKAAKHMMAKKKSEWDLIQQKYDPKGEHIEDFNRFLNGS